MADKRSGGLVETTLGVVYGWVYSGCAAFVSRRRVLCVWVIRIRGSFAFFIAGVIFGLPFVRE